ncbi:uncharacterized protein LOC132909396 [Bombus pascuorum]|uniref:uncharacterized protein LOC132909396 n=1 Tax=Bombus pascuorum TaxID=65598 RepID=UPI00298D8C35|nr:uncharacterized protein LOC132909396 [Bombus pascuorum]
MSRAVDVTDYDDSSARFDERTSVKEKLESPDRTIKHRSAGEISETRRAEAEVFSKKTKIERYDDSSRKWDKFDRVEGRDLTKTAAGTLEGKMRGKIKRNRDIDRTGEYPITPDGREERDDVPYKSKLDKIRGSRGLRDTNEERAAAGKMKKIKRDAKYLSQKRLEYTEFSETESEGTGVHRSREGDKGVPVITEKSPKERRKNKLHGHTLPENEGKKMVEKTTDTDIEEKTTGRRNRKKPRTEEDIELDETTDTGERKEADRRKKKKADGFDNEKKVVSYTFDKEDKVLKSGGTQDGRSSNERNETESMLTKKHRDVKRGVSSAEDKSTLDSGSQNKKETSKSSKKQHRRSGSDRTEDNSSKTNGSRYRKKRAIFSDIQIDDRSPIEYQLSNQHFVKLGWTVLPVAKTMRKIIQYRAKPSKPGLDWFRRHRLDGRTYYDDEARIFVNFHTDGSAEVFYPNGAMAIKLQRPQNRKYDIYTVFSPEGKDCMGVKRDSQIVAVFDTVGNGAVFNEDGATRLSYNQIGGIWRDNPTGVPLTWKWDICEKKSITKIVYLEKSAMRIEKLLNLAERRILKSSASVKASTSPASPRNKEKKVEELKPVVPEHDDEEEEVESGYVEEKKQIRPGDTYHFRPIHLNVNDYVGLKIFNRTNIILRFLADKKSIRIQLGTVLNLNEEVESYFVDTSLKHGMLKCKFEELLPSRLKLDSCMDDIAEKIQKVRRSARYRELMMAKYRPLLRVWKMSGTRCRPR